MVQPLALQPDEAEIAACGAQRDIALVEQQRVALALEPELLLMDEPLSNLDRALRVTMRRELKELQARMKMRTLYVTHDQEEALSMSNRVVIMNGGCVEQIARPYELYETPASSFVADFVGITNFFEGTLVQCAEDWDEVRLASGQPGDAVRALIRPERVTLLPGPEEGANILRGQVMLAEYFGAVLRYAVQLDSGETQRLEVYNFDAILENGTPVHVRVPLEHLRILPLDGQA